MDEKEFKKLIKKDKYQVFLFSCSTPIPYHFARHYWFVINKKGKINRWELLWMDNLVRTLKDIYYEESLKGKKYKILSQKNGHVYKNIFPPTKGLNRYHWKPRPLIKSSLVKVIEGNKKSLAHKMILFIEHNAFKYKSKNTYHALLGPNSNTFIEWIINKFPSSGFKL